MKYLHPLRSLSNKSFHDELMNRFAVGASAKNYRNMAAFTIATGF
jgi:hypothetical protein